MARKPKRLRAVKYNAGNMKWYKSVLSLLINSMNKNVKATLLNIFSKRIPSVDIVRHTLGELSDEWIDKFISSSLVISNEMANKTIQSADINMRQMAKAEGFAIKMNWTPAMQQVKDAVIAENVSLIKSIPEKYFTEVEGMVYRSLARGGDLKGLTDEIETHFANRVGITRRRAEIIAKDQIRKATSALTITRQEAAGVTHGIWVHSAGQANPRHKHVKAHGKVFKLSEGYPCGDRGQFVKPGEEINCSCTFRPIPPWEEIPTN
ncbi:phage minor head protein [Providencia rettgeri]